MIAERKVNAETEGSCNFWAEIAPTDHLVQIYDNDNVFLSTLEGFVGSGLLAGEAVIVIGTLSHINELNQRLSAQGLDVPQFIRSGQYIPEDANDILSRFMVNNWPDDELFFKTVEALFRKARGGNNRPVRAFGEMVAILWEKGNSGSTVRLEHLWNRFCSSSALCLFCAYPRIGFTQDPAEAMHQICCMHSKVLDGSKQATTEIYWKAANESSH